MSKIDKKIETNDEVKLINEKLNGLRKHVDNCDAIALMSVSETTISIADAFYNKIIDEKTMKDLLKKLSRQTVNFYYDCSCKKEKRKVEKIEGIDHIYVRLM